MSRLSVALQNDLKLLALLRDELGLQAHLFKAEMRDRWQDLEGKWDVLKVAVANAENAGADAARESESAIGLLADALRKGYENVRKSLGR
ncbi:hypothetical protein AAG565_03920 [Fontimonas sp. SYSU GA230001]|uniref:hypothetical protein n=1 Tax=Fontimonas sp. SYSU GA230001 TaxID=3142450 RepID=UPI0032B3FE57